MIVFSNVSLLIWTVQFVYRDGVYRAYRGIPQGNHASTRLCDLYLGAADCERYSEMMLRRDILLMRYVDDYLLLTTDFSVALKVIYRGFDSLSNIGKRISFLVGMKRKSLFIASLDLRRLRDTYAYHSSRQTLGCGPKTLPQTVNACSQGR